jgi:hypothetical protein
MVPMLSGIVFLLDIFGIGECSGENNLELELLPVLAITATALPTTSFTEDVEAPVISDSSSFN